MPTQSDLRDERPRNAPGKPVRDAIRTVRKHAVGEAGDGVLLVEHQRFRGRDAHERARKRGKAAQPEHDVRGAPTDDPAALPARARKREGPEHELPRTFATDAAERDALERDSMLRDELRLHALARAQPEHTPAARD